MIDKAELKSRVCAVIEERAADIEAISAHIMNHPEPGYREYETARYVAGWFDKLGIAHRDGLALTGIKAKLTGRSQGPCVAVIGELDSLIIPEHTLADPTTGAAHACGHNAQIASMLGAAMGLQTVMDHLDGDVALFAVPAEECIEIEWRQQLRAQGSIEFLVGKAELVGLGEFDDVDIAMLTHTSTGDPAHASVGDTNNGAVVKHVHYRGRSAHAGGAPWLGINALKAAMLGMAGIDAQRETFREDATVRIHPIITKGGDIVTAVPSDVRMEMLVRAKTLPDLQDAAAKVDRALKAGAMAIGAQVDIETIPAYMPCAQHPSLVALAVENCRHIVTDSHLGSPKHSTGSTDMGDLSQFMPVIQPRSGGTQGRPHSADYYVRDHRLAAVNPAKSMAMTVVDLLYDNAAQAKQIIAEASDTTVSKDEYLRLRREFNSSEIFPAVI
jgi:amidohydrolase